MSIRSGREKKREMLAVYHGYRVIKVTDIHYSRSLFDNTKFSRYPETIEIYYNFCREGDENYPSKMYDVRKKTASECHQCIDNFIKDDTTYFTIEERQKYVTKPNEKCEWGYGYNSLMKVMREHQKANNNRIKILIADRLEDANFHHEADLLKDGKYDEYAAYVRKEYTFKEKFEVMTMTECKAIKDPKQFEQGIAEVIANYLASQGVKNTSIDVKLIENW